MTTTSKTVIVIVVLAFVVFLGLMYRKSAKDKAKAEEDAATASKPGGGTTTTTTAAPQWDANTVFSKGVPKSQGVAELQGKINTALDVYRTKGVPSVPKKLDPDGSFGSMTEEALLFVTGFSSYSNAAMANFLTKLQAFAATTPLTGAPFKLEVQRLVALAATQPTQPAPPASGGSLMDWLFPISVLG